MKKTESSNAAVEPVEESSNILGDPLLAQAASEDPLFRFLERHWRQVLVIVAAVIAGYFGRQYFEESYVQSMKRAGDLLAGVQQQMAMLESMRRELGQAEKDSAVAQADIKKTAEEKDSAAKKALESKDKFQQGQDRVKELLLALSDARQPYSSLARIYQGILAAQTGDIKGARSSLETFNWQGFEAESRERFFAETAAMALAGALLDEESSYLQSRELLRTLAESGKYMNIAAALRLSRTSLTPEERSQALSIIEDLRGRFPEQSALLEAEAARLRH